MKNFILAAGVTLLVLSGPALAHPTTIGLEGSLRGTAVSPAGGEIEVVNSGGRQYLKFSENFAVISQAETEVRHVDSQTGKMTLIGNLVSRHGYQIYEVPDNITVDRDDKIVLYSPLHAADLATVELMDP